MNKRIGLIPWAKAAAMPQRIADLVYEVDRISVESRSSGVYLVAHFDFLPHDAWEIFDDIGWDESSG